MDSHNLDQVTSELRTDADDITAVIILKNTSLSVIGDDINPVLALGQLRLVENLLLESYEENVEVPVIGFDPTIEEPEDLFPSHLLDPDEIH